ncbi:23987_t:CDS:2, partial [Dentiscutata erythropus]
KKKSQKKEAKQGPLESPLKVSLEGPVPNQKHHYIPQFILHNFAINNYERKFVMSPNYQHQTLSYKKNKYLNNEKVMHVENELSFLERKASKIIRNILEKSQNESQIVLLRKDLNNLRKFLFIMGYRKPHRCSQFTKEKFDYPTWLKLKEFMNQCNLRNAREVWLQNIIQILKTPHKEVKDNPLIFEIDRDDYQQRMFDYFLVIWQAGESDEFLMTNNGFGIFEGVSEELTKGLPFQFAYHFFYVISPKLVLVLCHSSFRQGSEEFQKYFLQEKMGFSHSIFENVPHPTATPNYVSQKFSPQCTHSSGMQFDIAMNSIGLRRRNNVTFTFPFVKITSSAVHLVNSILLNETHEQDLIVSFISPSSLYKTIVKYHTKHKYIGIAQNFSNLKRNLFMTLNKTHEEDLCLRKKILVDRSDLVNFRNICTCICAIVRVGNETNEIYPLISIRTFFSQWIAKLPIL